MGSRKKNRVLIISYGFPTRIIKFIKYLPYFGWEPVVLTTQEVTSGPDVPQIEIDRTNIVSTKYFDLQGFVTGKLSAGKNQSSQTGITEEKYPRSNSPLAKALNILQPVYTLPLVGTYLLDPQGWYPYAVKKGLDLMSGGDIDLIFSTYTPSTCHFIASKLQKKTGIPWVAEFRDLWADNSSTRKIQPFYFLEKRLEKQVIRRSRRLITVSEPLAKKLEKLHSKQVTIIYNGFDDEDFTQNVTPTDKFTITYTGTMYNGKRDPTALFKAISSLKSEGRISAENFSLRFYGSSCPFLTRLIETYHLEDMVEEFPTILYSESVKRQMESSALLFLGWNDPRETGNLSTKIFEYFAARRPVLSLSHDSEVVSDLVTKSGCGIVANEAGVVRDIFLQWIEEFRNRKQLVSYWNPNAEIINKYTRKEQARTLSELFNNVVLENKKIQGKGAAA